jgi:vanillate O-demethylase monooxygenase subunit
MGLLMFRPPQQSKKYNVISHVRILKWQLGQRMPGMWQRDAEIDEAPLARTICGVPMVFYRKLDRNVVAMRDACPHRLLPLSLGIREGDSIRCKYHGMVLGPDGRAQEMPIRTDPVNTKICAETYITHERYRFVWVWIGDKEKADPSLIPDLWPCNKAGWTFRRRVLCDRMRLSPDDR